jgi:hypothetical protein
LRYGKPNLNPPWISNWQVQHYLADLETWNLVISTMPRFKTQHPIQMCSVHDVEKDEELLVQILSSEEAEILLATPKPSESFYCILCNNYSRMYVLGDLDEMGMHMYYT